jgi:hypothetical protein
MGTGQLLIKGAAASGKRQEMGTGQPLLNLKWLGLEGVDFEALLRFFDPRAPAASPRRKGMRGGPTAFRSVAGTS